jgi:hypothetical protein
MAIRATVRTTDARASAGRIAKTTTSVLSGKELAGSRGHRVSGNFAANDSSVVGKVRMTPVRAVLNHAPCPRRRVTVARGVTGNRVLAATGVKAAAAVKVLGQLTPGGKSNPETGALEATAAMARGGKAAAAARATRLPEAGWPGRTAAVVHRAISAATPGSRRISASI